MGDSPGLRLADLIELDGVELVMAEVDIVGAVMIKTAPQGHVLPDQGFADPQLVAVDADAPAVAHPATMSSGPYSTSGRRLGIGRGLEL